MTSPSGAVLNNTSWVSLASSVPDGSRTSAMVISNDNVYVGTNGQGSNPGNVYLKTPNASKWSLVGGSGVPDAGVVSGLAYWW